MSERWKKLLTNAALAGFAAFAGAVAYAETLPGDVEAFKVLFIGAGWGAFRVFMGALAGIVDAPDNTEPDNTLE